MRVSQVLLRRAGTTVGGGAPDRVFGVGVQH